MASALFGALLAPALLSALHRSPLCAAAPPANSDVVAPQVPINPCCALSTRTIHHCATTSSPACIVPTNNPTRDIAAAHVAALSLADARVTALPAVTPVNVPLHAATCDHPPTVNPSVYNPVPTVGQQMGLESLAANLANLHNTSALVLAHSASASTASATSVSTTSVSTEPASSACTVDLDSPASTTTVSANLVSASSASTMPSARASAAIPAINHGWSSLYATSCRSSPAPPASSIDCTVINDNMVRTFTVSTAVSPHASSGTTSASAVSASATIPSVRANSASPASGVPSPAHLLQPQQPPPPSPAASPAFPDPPTWLRLVFAALAIASLWAALCPPPTPSAKKSLVHSSSHCAANGGRMAVACTCRPAFVHGAPFAA